MNEQQFIKWFLEVANQEYKGDLQMLKANIQARNVEKWTARGE